jgi:uncharacterized phage-associated protein
MANVDDVVAFLLQQSGRVTTYELHKLLYYAQGWSLAWHGRPMFDAKVVAQEDGPCVSEIVSAHRGQRFLSKWTLGDGTRLTDEEREIVRGVLEMYGGRSALELADMTRAEAPWQQAWTGDPEVNRDITIESMRAFFTELAGSSASREVRVRQVLESLRDGDDS